MCGWKYEYNCDLYKEDEKKDEIYDVNAHYNNIYNELKKLELYEETYPKKKITAPQTDNIMTIIFLSYLYKFVIFIFLLSKPIINIFICIKNQYLPPVFIFEIIVPIEYILGCIYFSKSHFDKLYLKNTDSINLKCLPSPNNNVFYISVASLLYSIFSVILKITYIDYESSLDIFNYRDISITSRIFVIAYDFLIIYLGSLILINNFFAFVVIFLKQIKDIESIILYLNNIQYSSKNIDQLSFMCNKIIQIRHYLHISIKNFENILSTVSVIGAVTIGYIFKAYQNYNYSEYGIHSLIFYFILQFIFFYSVYVVANQKERLHTLLNSPKIVKQFLVRIDDKDSYDRTLEEINISTDLFSYKKNKEIDNATSLDWLILNNVLNQKWTQFTVFGVSLEDGNLLKNCVLIGTLLIVIK
jgi:hypothetical protein